MRQQKDYQCKSTDQANNVDLGMRTPSASECFVHWCCSDHSPIHHIGLPRCLHAHRNIDAHRMRVFAHPQGSHPHPTGCSGNHHHVVPLCVRSSTHGNSRQARPPSAYQDPRIRECLSEGHEQRRICPHDQKSPGAHPSMSATRVLGWSTNGGADVEASTSSSRRLRRGYSRAPEKGGVYGTL